MHGTKKKQQLRIWHREVSEEWGLFSVLVMCVEGSLQMQASVNPW